MQHVISTQDIRLTGPDSYPLKKVTTKGIAARFIDWCDRQESNRFLWLGIALMGGIGAVVPLTLSAIVFIGGNHFSLWVLACVVNVPVLVVNLSAQPTKITLPALFFAWTVDLLIIAWCVATIFMS